MGSILRRDSRYNVESGSMIEVIRTESDNLPTVDVVFIIAASQQLQLTNKNTTTTAKNNNSNN